LTERAKSPRKIRKNTAYLDLIINIGPIIQYTLHRIKQRSEAVTKEKILKGQYKFSDRVSHDAKDLIRRVFKLDPNERISIPEMLSHTWLRTSSIHNSPTKVSFPVFNSSNANNSSSSSKHDLSPLAPAKSTIVGHEVHKLHYTVNQYSFIFNMLSLMYF
jgi:serine/threonine protein kinase